MKFAVTSQGPDLAAQVDTRLGRARCFWIIDCENGQQTVVNNATLDEAREAGLPEIVEVITNGSDAPGTLFSDCSREFRRRFERADLIIAKGQAHYESLSGLPKTMFFLLKVKCPVVATDIGWPVGSLVVQQSCSKSDSDKVASISHTNERQMMTPMGDGTGPFGQGPVGGKGMGPCGGGQRRGWCGGKRPRGAPGRRWARPGAQSDRQR